MDQISGALHDLLVAEVPQALEHEKPHQSPDRQVGSPVGAVEREELFFKHAPVNRPSQTEKGVARIELAFQIGEQKGDFGLCQECLVGWSRIAGFLWIWAGFACNPTHQETFTSH